MIKLSGRRNSIYIINLIIWTYLRVINKALITIFYDFDNSFIFVFLMFLGELSAGLTIHKFQSRFLKGKEKLGLSDIIKLNTSLYETNQKTSKKLYIAILLFMGTFLDFVEFIIYTFYLPKYQNISSSLDSRCYSFLVICNSLHYRYLLKFPIFKHQMLSLIIIFICFLITIATEYIFQIYNEVFTYARFTEVLFLILIEYFSLSIMDTTDKFLLEFEQVDPFILIIFQGLFGSIFSLISFIFENPFIELKKIYENNSSSSFGFLLFLLFLYYILSALRNAFRVLVNKLYSPMVITLSDYFLNPIFILFHYLDNNDFKSKEGQNIFYFLLNFILSTITALSTCIYNEFFVLFCCNLETNTHDQISKRAKDEISDIGISKIMTELSEVDESDEKNGIYRIYV